MSMVAAPVGVTCHRCKAPGQTSLFCQNCSLFLPDETGTVEKVTYNRRFWGTNFLENLLLVLTLGVGWLIWLAFTAPNGQSPAKSLLRVYVIDTDTYRVVSGGRIWVREVLVKIVLVQLIAWVTLVGGLINALWVFPDKNRQALHDKLVSTVVVYAPHGLPQSMGGVMPGLARVPEAGDVAEQLRELAKLRDEGILTTEEYERKRSELAGKL